MRKLLVTLAALVACIAPATAGAQTIPANATGSLTYNTTNALGVVCNTAINLDLLRVTAPSNAGNAVTLDPGCTGRIDRVEITTSVADGIKIRNNSTQTVHDFVIDGGFIRGIAHEAGAHADCVQGMGGDRITFNNILCDFRNRPGGGSWYIGIGGAGTAGPSEDVVCNNCHFIHGATSVRMDSPSVRSGMTNSVICDPLGQAEAAAVVFDTDAVQPVGVTRVPVTIRNGFNEDALDDGNIVVANTDPRCTTEPTTSAAPECSDGVNNDPGEDALTDFPADPGCLSATDDSELGNPPPPTCDAACVQAYEDRIANLEAQTASLLAEIVDLEAQIDALQAENNSLRARVNDLEGRMTQIRALTEG